MNDVFGTALLDFQTGKCKEDILTSTSISDEETLSVSYLFRTYDEMLISYTDTSCKWELIKATNLFNPFIIRIKYMQETMVLIVNIAIPQHV